MGKALFGHHDETVGRAGANVLIFAHMTRVRYWSRKPLFCDEANHLRNDLRALASGNQIPDPLNDLLSKFVVRVRRRRFL